MVIPLPSPEEVSLYFHIPFCTKKCDYCHFYVIPDNASHKEKLVVALKKEWDLWAPKLKNRKLASLYFGGGTPALFGPEKISAIVSWVRELFPDSILDSEITLEVNPENASVPLMKAYRDAGINRISLGLQSLDDGLLQILSRGHRSNKAVEAVHAVHDAGFNNITVDLMYELPTQSMQQWKKTIDLATQLPITHLSLYNLTIEPKTSFYKRRDTLNALLPDEETRLEMYEHAVEAFERADLLQYEISAFAREGFYSRHNTGYWTGREFIGFGPSAFSYWEKRRFSNVANLNKYARALDEGSSAVDFEEKLPSEAHLRELLAVELRLRCGVDVEAFMARHGTLDDETLYTLDNLMEEDLLEVDSKGRLRLTESGVLYYDSVATEII